MSKPWYRRNWPAIAGLIFLPPLGLLFVWLTDWPRQRKFIASGAGLFWWLIVTVSDPSDSIESSTIESPAGSEIDESKSVAADLPSESGKITRKEVGDVLYTVTRIYDGDTLEAFKDGETIKVRLACIDAPEAEQQPYGDTSRARLSELVPGQVRLNIVDEDRYKRFVAEVYTPNGDYVNQQMLESGDAVVYDDYLQSCGTNAATLLAAEEQAQSAAIGVWSDPDFVMPWDYRRGVGAVVPEPETVVETDTPTTTLPACVSGDCDCSDFSSWQQAQDVLAAYPGDPHRLDRDKDGEACEGLR